MKLSFKSLVAASAVCCGLAGIGADAEVTANPAAVRALLDRIGGQGASSMMETVLDTDLGNGTETFVITSAGGKPCVKGSTMSALTTGINWYLNHTANINLTWNRPTTTFGQLPVPASEETHRSNAAYRYYLNYCTFSYSMSTWTWERWQQELDYMALHGINMPLQIIGLDVVWRNLLTKDFGYTKDQADAFIAGPCFQAWWGMNNLEGWGGKNPDWWYERQEQLARKILARMRELGIEPVLPGFAGMVPHDFTAKTGLSAITQGGWCGFTRPYILNPETDAFKTVAQKYYARLHELMGTSEYYSMDPFHEGANTSGISNIGNAYKAIYEAMNTARPASKWVIQQWQWSGQQYSVLDNVPKGRLIVLDLFSDGKPNLGAYRGHDVVYCALPNFGGRTGLMGRFNGMINGYFSNKPNIAGIKGVGATPEAIEQVPVLYDVLFELPWHSTKPDPKKWMKEYSKRRYGQASEDAAQAWELLRNSALNCTSGLQGPHEAVMCARPNWTVNSVSTWGSSNIFYDTDDVVKAAYLLLSSGLDGENFSYDLTDITRQTMSDYSYHLLKGINEARAEGGALFESRKAAFLQLILDVDRLLGTNENFMLGRWTTMARGIADEVSGTTAADKNWLELNNARTIISTWGERNNAEGGGLHDYSYRQWNGMLKDYYYPRWQKFFNGESPNWFDFEHSWAMNSSLSYDTRSEGDTRTIAAELLGKYIIPAGDTYVYRTLSADLTKKAVTVAYRGEKFTAPLSAPSDLAGEFTVTYGTTSFKGLEQTVPSNAKMGDFIATASLPDGTEVKFRISVRDRISGPFTVKVRTSDASMGSVSIDGADGPELTTETTEGVSVRATANAGYRFYGWKDGDESVSTDNPYRYYGGEDIELVAEFSEAPLLVAGDVTFAYDLDANGDIIITGVDSGSGYADLTAVDKLGGKKIVAIAKDALKGSQALHGITIPASCTALDGLAMSASYAGKGEQNHVFRLDEPVAKGSSWALVLKVKNNGSSFNQWGSGLFATGTDALGTSYNGGFQLYLAKDGKMVVKTESIENRDLTNIAGAAFTVTVTYDAGARCLAVRLTNADGKTQEMRREGYDINEIASFSTSIPAGVDIEYARLTGYGDDMRPFALCTSLTDINIETGHPLYTSAGGKLLSADGKTLTAYPEGRLFERVFRLAAANGRVVYANPGANADGEIIDLNRRVMSANADEQPLTSLWRLTAGKAKCKVEHLDSHRFFGSKAGGHDRVELPVSATSNHGEYDYQWKADGTACMLALSLGNGMYATYSDSYIKLASDPYYFSLQEAETISLPEGVHAVAFPVDAELTSGDARIVTGLDNETLITSKIETGSAIAAGTGFLVNGAASFRILAVSQQTTEAGNSGENRLSGTLLGRTGMTPDNFFTLNPDTKKFERNSGTETANNTAYLTASAFGNPIAATSLHIDFTGTNSLENITSGGNGSGDNRLYDLTGRPAANNPQPGIYIAADGTKVIL